VVLDLGLRYWSAGDTAVPPPASTAAPTQADNWVRGFVSNLGKPTSVSPNAAIAISLL
jgi:hypothetical protein